MIIVNPELVKSQSCAESAAAVCWTVVEWGILSASADVYGQRSPPPAPRQPHPLATATFSFRFHTQTVLYCCCLSIPDLKVYRKHQRI
jgi:hypothetical protein